MHLNKLVLASTAILAFTGLTYAAEYPTKPIRFIIAFPAGGPTDVAGRVIAQGLSQSLGQSMVIDNRPGADGAIGPEIVAKAAPDGYTMLMGTSSSMAAVPAMRKNPPYDPVADFAPISFLGWNTLLLVVNSSLPAKSISELIDYARANPGKLNVASANPPSIFAMAQLKSLSNIDFVSVTYKGDANALPDLVAGRAHVLAAGVTLVQPHIKEGRLRALAVLSAARARLVPDVPTMAEAGVPRFGVFPWVGLFGPAKTPKAIVDKLAREVNALYKRAEVREGLEKVAFDYGSSTPEKLAGFVKDQMKVWATVARESGISPQ
jgi:tripartite-type tricarboxylate transporter receptor subunit TctC